MEKRKIPNLALAFVVIASLLVGASGATSAAVSAPEVAGSAFARAVTLHDALTAAPAPPDPAKKYQNKHEKALEKQNRRVDPAERQAAADLAGAKGFELPAIGEAVMAAAGVAPHYFSHPNYANSPLPVLANTVTPTPVGNALQDRAYASDFPVGVGVLAPVFVVLPTALPAGTLTSFQTWNQATSGASPFPSAGNVFHAFILRPTGVANEYTVALRSGPFTVPALTTPGISEVAVFPVSAFAVLAGDVLAFYGQGIPLADSGGSDILSYPAPNAPVQGGPNITLGGTDFPILNQVRTYSFGAIIDVAGTTPTITGGIKKFVDGLPGLGLAAQTTSASTSRSPARTRPPTPARTTTRSRWCSTGRRCTRTCRRRCCAATCSSQGKRPARRAAVELFNAPLDPLGTPVSTGYCGRDHPHYLGPTIVATKDGPCASCSATCCRRAQGGNLFIPTDITVMGSGMGPSMWGMPETNPQESHVRAEPEARRLLHREPRHAAPARRHHAVDQRRHAAPVDHALRRAGAPHRQRVRHGNKGVSVQYVPDMWYDASGNTIASCAGQTTCAVARRDELPGQGRADLLLHQPAERPAAVLPRPRLGHHPPERLRRRGRRLPDHR